MPVDTEKPAQKKPAKKPPNGKSAPRNEAKKAKKPAKKKSKNQQVPKLELLPIDSVNPDPDQPRKHFGEKELESLKRSTEKANGVSQPIVVWKRKDGLYQILTGERRWRAAKMAGHKKILTMILDGAETDDEADRLLRQMEENMVRSDLSLEERVVGAQRLSEMGRKNVEIAAKLGRDRSCVTKMLAIGRLLDGLPEAEKSCVTQHLGQEELYEAAREKNEEVRLSALRVLIADKGLPGEEVPAGLGIQDGDEEALESEAKQKKRRQKPPKTDPAIDDQKTPDESAEVSAGTDSDDQEQGDPEAIEDIRQGCLEYTAYEILSAVEELFDEEGVRCLHEHLVGFAE